MSPRNHGPQAGFTFLEMLITLSFVVTMVLLVIQLAVSSGDAQDHAARQSRAVEINQDLVDGIRMELLSAVRVFQNDALGNAYTDLLEVTTEPIQTTQLPTIKVGENFGQETATADKTGNALVFASHAWTDEFVCTSGESYRLDVYRIHGYYLTEAGNGPQPSNPIGLNLVRWVSEPMVDGGQVDRITDATDQEEVLEHLLLATPDAAGDQHDPVEVVWDLGADPAIAGTLRHIGPGGFLWTTPLAPRDPTWAILRDPRRSSDGLLFYRHFSIATNYAPKALGVGQYSVVDPMGDGFPHGFEVQVIGPSRGRQVLVSCTIVSTKLRGLPVASSLRNAVHVREL